MTGKSRDDWICAENERLSHLTCGSNTRGQAPRLPEGSEAFQMRGHEVGGAPWVRRRCVGEEQPDCFATSHPDVFAQRKPRRGPARPVATTFLLSYSAKK